MKLLVSSETEHLLSKALALSSEAILVTEGNYLTAVASDGIGYTSIIEFNDKNKFVQAIMLASEVDYLPDPTDNILNLDNPTSSDRGLTENLISQINQTKHINGIDHLLKYNHVQEHIDQMCYLTNNRTTEQSTLWAVGCSCTQGTGVNQDQRWGDILGKQLDVSTVFLAQGGASISWNADQILRSDIRANDIVVWGLTALNRLPYYNTEHGLIHHNAHYPSNSTITNILLDDDYMYYQSITHILQVINFCNKIGCKLLLVGLLASDRDYLYYRNLPNYYQYHNPHSFNKYVDLGTDNQHPGPKQHRLYADAIYHQLKLRNWI